MKTISMLVAVMMAAGALVLPLSFSMANADTLCKFNAANQRCDLDVDKVTGGFKLSIVNEQNNGGGGSGNVSTVDQVARDQNTVNDQKDVILKGNVTTLAGLVKGLVGEVAQLRADIQTLNNSAITGISLSNGSAVVTPPGPEPVVCVAPEVNVDGVCVGPVEPPNDNNTGNGTSGNNTGNETGGNFTG
jgi:hypothetical protein